VTRSTCFPITEGKWGDAARKALPGVPPGHRAAIRQLSPWKYGNQELWLLHRLDIMDKHRGLMVVLMRYRGIVIGGGEWRLSDGQVVHIPEIALNAANKEPVHDGYVAYTQPLDAEGPYANLPKITLELALQPEPGTPEEPLSDVLRRVVSGAERAVAHVRRTCSLT
jgi:hypothetical protein